MVAGFLAITGGAAHAVIVADLGADWVDASTLPTNYQYLSADAANGGTETALTPNVAIGNGGFNGFGGGTNSFNLGAVLGGDPEDNTIEIFGDGDLNSPEGGVDLLVHTGDSANLGGDGVDYVIIRYTITAADLANGTTASVVGSFRNLISGGDAVTASIYKNETELFSASGVGTTLTQADGTFSLQTTVAEGDQIDFVVFKNGTLFADETAVRATIDLGSGALPPALTVDPTSLNFGAVELGQSSTLTITVENTGGGTLDGTATTNPPFAIVSGVTYSLGAGETQEIEVSYSPGKLGSEADSVTLTGASGATVALNGSGSTLIGVPGQGNAAGDWIASDGATGESVVGGTSSGWSYFRSDAANGGNEIPLVASIATGDVGGPGFADIAGGPRRLPAVVGDNANGGDYELFGDGNLNGAVEGTDLLIHPNTGDGEFVIVRRTMGAGESGEADIAGSFRNLVGGVNSVEVFVYHNNVELFTAVGTGNTLQQGDGTFELSTTVAPGDTIDFVVGSRGNISGDETALQAFIVTAGGGPELRIRRSGGGFEIEWDSREGRQYDLVSSVDLATPVSTWPVYDDGTMTYEDIPASGLDINTLSGVQRVGPVRFFAIIEEPVPPLFSTDFEPEAGPSGFTVVTTAGTAWAHGSPDSSGIGGTVSSGNNDSASCWGTGLGDFAGSGDEGFFVDPTDTCLRSPIIDLTGVTAAELRFAQALDLDVNDSVVVNIIDDLTDTPIASDIVTIADGDTSNAAWTTITVEVPEVALGQPVRFEWCLNGTGGGSDDYLGWYIDDVSVTEQ